MNKDSTQTNSTDSKTEPAGPLPIVCWVGLDWADQKHCLVVRTAVGGASQHYLVEHKPETLDAWFLELRQKHPSGRIAVAIEQSRGPVLYGLLKYDFLAIYPVNPRCLADYRRAFKISGAKDDPLDANLLCELVSLHPDRLRPLMVEDIPTRKLRLLVEARRGFVHDSTHFSNRLRATLKCYYPLGLELAGEDLTAKMTLDFLRRWPNLAKLQAAKPGVLREFFYAHNSRSEKLIQERLEAVRRAKPLTEDPALIAPLQLQMEHLVQQLRTLQQTVAAYDKQIAEAFAQHSEACLFSQLPGAGPVLGARLAAAFGTIRANFASNNDLLSFSGIAPVRKQSGTQELIQFRYARPIFVHQTFVEFAKCSIPQCAWASVLYQEALRQGKSRWVALRKVAFKWLRILWRCWQERQAYDELTYLRSLQRDGVELYRSLYQVLPAPEAAVKKS